VTVLRTAFFAAAIAAAATQPACAQHLMRLLERGPVGFLHGQTLLQVSGDLTAGDFSHPAVADWDGDGSADLVVGSGYGDLLLFSRPDDGPYEPARALLPAEDLPLGAVPQRRQISPWLGDLDGDGTLDLLMGVGERVYRYVVRDAAAREGRLLAGPGSQVTLPGPLAPAAADLDGDGTAEVIIADGRGQLHRLVSSSAQPVVAGGAILQVTPPVRAWAGDWDGDARADLLLGAGDGRVLLCAGGASGLAGPAELLSSGDRLEAAPWATDFDADGDLDLLVGERGGRVVLFTREGDVLTEAGALQQHEAPIDAGRCPVATAGDWDGDGDQDLVIGGEDGSVRLYERVAGGELRFARGLQSADDEGLVMAPGEGPLRYAAPALTDWDSDGDLDLLVGGACGEVHLWRNDRGLRHAGPMRVSGEPLVLAGITMPAPFDYNGDGDMDVFIGARPRPDRRSGEGIVLPELAPGCAYFENTTDRAGVLPIFAKGVPLAMTITSEDAGLRRDAGFLAPYATYPTEWTPGRIDFITVTLQGTFVFRNTAGRGSYALLETTSEGRALPRALLPPLYSAVPVRLDERQGLLAAGCASGFVVWYPREALEP